MKQQDKRWSDSIASRYLVDPCSQTGHENVQRKIRVWSIHVYKCLYTYGEIGEKIKGEKDLVIVCNKSSNFLLISTSFISKTHSKSVEMVFNRATEYRCVTVSDHLWLAMRSLTTCSVSSTEPLHGIALQSHNFPTSSRWWCNALVHSRAPTVTSR